MADLAQISLTTVPRARAHAAIDAALAHGGELGIPFTVAVLDNGGHVVAVVREDGAALASIETSQSKARTALYFAQPTQALQGALQPGAPLFSIEGSTSSPLAFVGGGVPLTDEAGRVIGAIGVGGGSPDQDHDVAATAAAAFAG